MPDEQKPNDQHSKESDWVRIATIAIALVGWALAAWQASKDNKPIPPLPPVFLMAPAPAPAPQQLQQGQQPPAVQVIPMIPMDSAK